jgi:AcrR family transcriptional regulator
MAEIAVAARMSVGQIYRYFPNKEAIVHAIVERIVAQRLQGMMETAGSEDLPTVLAERIAAGDMDYREDHILMLEVTAEATRNPAVAEIVRQAGERLNRQALATFRHRHPGVDESEVAGRLELIAVLFEGSVFRHMTQQQGSTAVPAALYREVLAKLLTP